MRKICFWGILLVLIGLIGQSVLGEVPLSSEVNGRGTSDSGRSEPHYVGLTGYLAVDGHFSGDDDSCLESPWFVSTYELNQGSWMETGKVEHKTEVRVLWQELQHEGWGRYSGMLQVERLDNGKHLYVDVKTFITKPYWTYSDLQEAARVGTYLARFQQVSNHYPVNKNGEGVDLEDGMVIAVVGNTGTYGHGGPDDETNQLEALVFKEWQSGYEGVQVFFNAEDLTIVY